ncbi:hypothetical protein A5765_05175 [Mycolicibacterium celeriflavum]|uniref:hypothetical protein n=1 Tax=Mycolicibacterium celeriflavum TaxID=1249101 RepID=UPI0007FB7BAA|nr:hypothetical protein [Mycolicibacterium celeriflavum]OBG17987.1 hypothetical protein A5765_05175 [Mycolicibacterium celeriflavum]
MIDRYCISHKRPLLPAGWYDHCIALGDFQPDSVFHVSHLDQFWHEARPIAYGAAGTYVLPIAIQRFSGDADFIEVSNYRKRILPSREGVEAYKYPTLRELDVESFGKTAELSIFIPKPEHEFLIAQPLHVKKSIFGHYKAVHHRRDILDYTSLAVEMGVLDSKSASEFLAAKHFIPGGVELGIYPKAWLVRALSSIELLGREFLNRHGNRLKYYNAFQIRAVGFLSERLGSFILIRHLVEKYSNNIPAEIFGHMTVIVEGDSRYSAGLTDRPKKRWDSHNRKDRQVR